ncbi:hypothetical protein C5167_005733 [Papaver somniferum]|uniref:Uncharacterized protein n=1 Tax=Papaver somniferum TaxID=3469 RepID=A0A4Y7JEG2_PAPSO|nr:uncharacterized protein LOC113272627 [Papaver somniferum]RZC58432.1 hypothetical protein C5167_005733 [Papaver somniferum]
MVLLIIRFKSSFVLGILFILVAFRDSINAHTQQALEKKPAGTENGFWMNRRNVVSVDQEFFDGVPTVADMTSENNKKLGGRKMLVTADNDRKTAIKHENAGQFIGEATTKISGAEHSSVGNTDKSQKGNNEGVELNVESNKFMSNTDRSSLPVNVSLGDSIAVSADYLDPRPHPPKNN